ncbi:hypothetical protein JS518_14205 [Clostridiales bacterium FE2010]|nr:hypothetical protein JS518_14205 [Clostridiales bacterium FE2010]
MLIIPYVCAEFHDRSGTVIHRITPAMRGTMVEVPESIKQDVLFTMLVKDGSIKTPETSAQKKTLEKDPMVGVTAEGRSAVIAGGEKPAKPVKAAKAETKADDKSAGVEKK